MVKVNNQKQQVDWSKVKPEDYRQVRGKLIFEDGKIEKQNNYFIVGSQTSFKEYKVRFCVIIFALLFKRFAS